MTEVYQAILFDTRSIQRYIYTGNRLKTNIGASYLVKHVFSDLLVPVLEQNYTVDADSWRNCFPTEKLKQKKQAVFAANGGGNACVIFSADVTANDLRKVSSAFSRTLLVKLPGLHIGAAIGSMRLGEEYFQKDLGVLFRKLKENQAKVFPQVSIPYTGLTLRCPVNGEVANFYDREGRILKGGQKFCSQETAVKTKAAEAAQQELERAISETSDLCQRYTFPMEFEELGQIRDDKNFFAIVHIDGNNMGEKFRGTKTQHERSLLSDQVQKKTWGCFLRLLESIDTEYDRYLLNGILDLGGVSRGKQKGKPYLPIRPLVIGGDDVTFVCPAQMAIPYAKRFMEAMADAASVSGIEDERAQRIDSCAGIAILKTTYPFFRGYTLAEQLCDAAKDEMRARRVSAGDSCWLDFAILHGEQAPTLEAIRAQEYTGAQGREGGLHFGPYQVAHADQKGSEKEHRKDIENLLEAVHQLQGSHGRKACMAHGKTKDLRLVLQRDAASIHQFLVQLEHIGQNLPNISDWQEYQEEGHLLFVAGETPYVDAIEMMEFLPKEDDLQ